MSFCKARDCISGDIDGTEEEVEEETEEEEAKTEGDPEVEEGPMWFNCFEKQSIVAPVLDGLIFFFFVGLVCTASGIPCFIATIQS